MMATADHPEVKYLFVEVQALREAKDSHGRTPASAFAAAENSDPANRRKADRDLLGASRPAGRASL